MMKKVRLMFPLCFLYAVSSLAQPYRSLILEGAGIRGLAYAGAIKRLQEAGITDSIKRVCGTSAGAITAVLFSLRYNADEIDSIVCGTRFGKFNDGRYFFIGGVHRVKREFGWYRGNTFNNWIGTLIQKRTGNADITFKGLHDLGYRDLYITATSLTLQKLVIFSYENYPEMKVRDAVRASMSIPLYYEGVWIDSAGRIIHNPPDKTGLQLVVDGGIIGNYPIHVFDSARYMDGSRTPANSNTIGIRIDNDWQILSDTTRRKGQPVSYRINDFGDYMMAFYILVMENLNREGLTEDDWKRTISISDGGLGPRVRNLTANQKTKLVNNGYMATDKFLEKIIRK